MAENENKLTEEQKEQIKAEIKEQLDRMGEVFSQCWESDEFKQAFIEDPKAIFKEYGVNYIEDKEYVIIDSPEKTLVKVLPYEKIKSALREFSDNWMKKVEDIDDDEGKQIILDGWKELIYQNTADKYYIAIPHCPDSLTPEELEMVNGGCFFAVFILIAQSVVFATTLAVGAEVAAWLAIAVAEVAAAVTTGVAVLEVFAVLAYYDVACASTHTWVNGSGSNSADEVQADASGKSMVKREGRNTIR